MDAGEAVDLFRQAWNTPDDSHRLRLLTSFCAADAEFVSPEGVVRGMEPFSASIGGLLRTFPRAEVWFGAPDVHHGYAHVRWRTRFNDGACDPIFGDDFMLLDAAGRLIRVVSFDGNPADA